MKLVSCLLVAAGVALAAPTAALAQTLEQMAGQMIVVGFKGNGVGDASVKAIRDDIASGTIGGVMYLKANVASTDAVDAMNDMFVAAAPANLPPFITIDQEGGAVERLTKAVGFPEVPRAAEVARLSREEARRLYSQMASGLADLGFTVNFGPVADVIINEKNEVIAKFGRAFSADPAVVAEYDRIFINAHHESGVLTALKHFPGHGSSTADSHNGFVDITRTWQPKELDPYTALFESGFDDFVMVGHLYHSQDDLLGSAEQPPASLSAGWIEVTLRGDMGFQGVVISDDLEMGAIRKLYSTEEAVVAAVNAGMDVLLFSNTAAYSPALGRRIRDMLVAEAQSDPAFAERIKESYARIARLKSRIGKPMPAL